MKTLSWRTWLPLLLILLTTLFIWSNSMQDGDASKEQSDFVGEILEEIVDVEREPFKSLFENRRKVAHFCEFALLGVEVGLFLSLRHRRPAFAWALGWFFCFLVACLDETIQLFTPGRASLLADVWLDAGGALCGLLLPLLVLLSLFLFRVFKEKSRNARGQTD